MEKQSFKGMTIAVIAGIIAAALLLLISCLLPRVVISELDRSCEHDLAEALRYAVQGENGTAYTHILNIRKKTEGFLAENLVDNIFTDTEKSDKSTFRLRKIISDLTLLFYYKKKAAGFDESLPLYQFLRKNLSSILRTTAGAKKRFTLPLRSSSSSPKDREGCSS